MSVTTIESPHFLVSFCRVPAVRRFRPQPSAAFALRSLSRGNPSTTRKCALWEPGDGFCTYTLGRDVTATRRHWETALAQPLTALTSFAINRTIFQIRWFGMTSSKRSRRDDTMATCFLLLVRPSLWPGRNRGDHLLFVGSTLRTYMVSNALPRHKRNRPG